jgi:alkaline phosphatase D
MCEMKVLILLALAATLAPGQEARQATGVKIGEVTPDSAIVWMRLTQNPKRNQGGLDLRGHRGDKTVPPDAAIADLEGAAPGAPGRVRLRYSTDEELSNAKTTPWMDVSATADYAQQFRIQGLSPATRYYYSADTTGPGGSPRHGSLTGTFATAPRPDESADVTFTVVTGMMYADLDHPDGYHIYESMLGLKPDFLVPTGDTVYYDNENPPATSAAVARYHWDRMYSLPRHIAFHLKVPAYWEKDDHDVYFDDCWPGMERAKMGAFTFKQGQEIFLQQVPADRLPYRRVRWGKHLEVWLVEGRDFRSPNTDPDGPEKTIWGAEQKKWLKRTLLESDAEWKVLVSPTPMVGPDREKKNDNHANQGFAHEGREMRSWFAENLPDNFFIACGDRHWQYHSVDPVTKVQEFSSGPASDEHAAGAPGLNEDYHVYHAVRGGFLSVNAGASGISFRHHDVHGNVVYEYRREARR